MRKLIIALALFPLAACTTPERQAAYADTWSIVMDHSANSYVLDHGLSLDDCMAAKPVNRPDLDQWYACERERAN